jgi:hypothetical protein
MAVVTTRESGHSMSGQSGAPTGRSLLKSLGLHLAALVLVLLIPAQAMRTDAAPTELEVVFHRPRPPVEVPAPKALPPGTRELTAAAPPREGGGRPIPTAVPDERLAASAAPGTPDLPPGAEASPVAEVQPQRKVGEVGILAFRDQIASLSRDKVVPRLGAEARYSAADDTGRPSARSGLTTSGPGSSGGINAAALSRTVGGGGGGGGKGNGGDGRGGGDGSGGGGGLQGVQVGRATSTIAGIGGGDDRPKARSGVGPSRTDEEIQIVFDRHKASFYRLYNRELRTNPTLQGQMILRLTIEPDGSVSMCVLQSSDMNAPDLAAQVVERVKGIDFGAKEGVRTVTISYPIDFLPAS